MVSVVADIFMPPDFYRGILKLLFMCFFLVVNPTGWTQKSGVGGQERMQHVCDPFTVTHMCLLLWTYTHRHDQSQGKNGHITGSRCVGQQGVADFTWLCVDEQSSVLCMLTWHGHVTCVPLCFHLCDEERFYGHSSSSFNATGLLTCLYWVTVTFHMCMHLTNSCCSLRIYGYQADMVLKNSNWLIFKPVSLI